jgi:hypothetical protein
LWAYKGQKCHEGQIKDKRRTRGKKSIRNFQKSRVIRKRKTRTNLDGVRVRGLVPLTGLEPVWHFCRGILSCYTFCMSYDVMPYKPQYYAIRAILLLAVFGVIRWLFAMIKDK